MPCIVYAAFGSSRQLAVGPVAVTSMILGTGLGNMFDFVNADPNKPTDPAAQDEYNRAAIQVRAAPHCVQALYVLEQVGGDLVPRVRSSAQQTGVLTLPELG